MAHRRDPHKTANLFNICSFSLSFQVSLGSRRSLRLSPNRLKTITVIKIASPEKIMIHGAVCM
jgi:hypothetical protein